MSEINWKKEVETRKDDLYADLATLVGIDSVRKDEEATAEFPVGPGPVKALDAFLEIGERDGFETEKFENWAGHILFGEGEEDLGILMHVDVVPIDTGWETDPFELTLKDGRLYGRGTSDDKGPGLAAYYGMKIIKELGLETSRKVRFIIGTDEERDWQCMDHYFSVQPQPTLGFSPDAHFPIINGEKGNYTLYFNFGGNGQGNEFSLLSFQAGQAENMVPQNAEALVEAADTHALVIAFDSYLEGVPVTGQATVDGSNVTLSVTGQASHGAQPENGENAGTYLADFLSRQAFENDAKVFLEAVSNFLHDDPFGEKLGVAKTDDLMGRLTSNIGVIRFQDGQAGRLAVNYRYPKNTDPTAILNAVEDKVAGAFEVEEGGFKEPHYVSEDTDLVQTLLSVYEKQTGLEGHGQVIGGGTYARLLENGVAYGAMFPDSVDTMHQSNEFISERDLLTATAIYAEAIYELIK